MICLRHHAHKRPLVIIVRNLISLSSRKQGKRPILCCQPEEQRDEGSCIHGDQILRYAQNDNYFGLPRSLCSLALTIRPTNELIKLFNKISDKEFWVRKIYQRTDSFIYKLLRALCALSGKPTEYHHKKPRRNERTEGSYQKLSLYLAIPCSSGIILKTTEVRSHDAKIRI